MQAFPRACGGEREGGWEGQAGWRSRWRSTCISLLMESPKPGAGSRVTQVALAHWTLPSPKNCSAGTCWQLPRSSHKTHFRARPCHKPVLRLHWWGLGLKGSSVLGLHSGGAVVVKRDSPGQTFSKEVQSSSGLPSPTPDLWYLALAGTISVSSISVFLSPCFLSGIPSRPHASL